MRHLNSGEIKLFNIKTDYREQYNLATSMPEKAQSMDAILAAYVEAVDGGTAEQVREALYNTMDKFADRANAVCKKKSADLKEQKPADCDAQKAAMLAELNRKLIKNAINVETCRKQQHFIPARKRIEITEWKESVLSRWVDYTGD